MMIIKPMGVAVNLEGSAFVVYPLDNNGEVILDKDQSCYLGELDMPEYLEIQQYMEHYPKQS